MSYYFEIKTKKHIRNEAIIEKISTNNLTCIQGNSQVCFFVPFKSVRGVNVYPHESGYSVGINAFTSRFDAELIREIVFAIALLSDGSVTPEDEEDPISLNEIRNFGRAAWIETRYNEATTLVKFLQDKDPSSSTTIHCYRRPYQIRASQFDGDLPDMIQTAMKRMMELQEIEESTDIFAASLLQTSLPVRKKSLLERFNVTKRATEDCVIFVLGKEIRTLTPINTSKLPLYVILQDENSRHHRIHSDVFYAFADQHADDEFGHQCYDITLNSHTYLSLIDLGKPVDA